MGLTPTDVAAWPDLVLVSKVDGGHRNEVWQGDLGGCPVAVRRSRREPESLAWELGLLAFLHRHDFVIPMVVATADGESSSGGVVVQNWLPGREPSSPEDWQLVADELQRLHRVTVSYPQRPGCSEVHRLRRQRRSVDADVDELPDDVTEEVLAVFEALTKVPTAVVHGDPGASNIRIGTDGLVGLLDWDESRVDLVWHDLSNLGIQVLAGNDHSQAQALSHAWEAVNGWLAEPTYARRRLDQLRDLVRETS